MIRNLGIALLSTLLALTACEILLRVFGDEFGAPVVVNSKILRSRETPYEKAGGVLRILALGDSWTFGFRTEEPDAYPRQLERMLNERARNSGQMSFS